jgi:hypothetical protein
MNILQHASKEYRDFYSSSLLNTVALITGLGADVWVGE